MRSLLTSSNPGGRTLAVMLALSACTCGHAPPAAEVHEAADEPPPITEARRQMHDRYDAVQAIRDALVDGYVDRAKELARPIGPVRHHELSSETEPLRDVVPTRLATMMEADTVDTAAPAFAQLVMACGECHRRAGVAWPWQDEPIPPGDDVESHMQRHLWAVDRMWEALLGDDPTRFDAAARVLAEAPLHRSTGVEVSEPEEMRALARRVHYQASTAEAAEDMSARAAIYGELLVTCARCHELADAAAEAVE